MPLSSIISYDASSDFPAENIPFGVFSTSDGDHIATRVGDTVIDLHALEKHDPSVLHCPSLLEPTLNKFMSLGKSEWRRVRGEVQKLITGENPLLKDNHQDVLKKISSEAKDAKMVLPATIGDYTDCYASRCHAVNVGTMFRGKDNALMPNWTHLPVAYHGRASSVVVSGTDTFRPHGQVKKTPKDDVDYMADPRVDFELEVGAFVGTGNDLGSPMSVAEAKDNLFGLVLMNDCSARGIQAYEYVPLGPFTGKNWCTVISPWIVTMDALEEFRTNAPELDHEVLPYLQEDRSKAVIDVNLTVELSNEADIPEPAVISRSNLKHLYWSFEQQTAHHTVSGCNMRPGDLIGSGTISGPTREAYGSILELCWKGETPLEFPNGVTRKFLQDGDRITLKGHCQGDGYRIGFGTCTNKLLPAKK